MKKIMIALFIVVLMSSMVLAQGQQGIHEPGTGIEEPELRETGQGTGEGAKDNTSPGKESIDEAETGMPAGEQVMAQERMQVKAQTENELKAMVQQKQQEMNNELKGLNKDEEKVYKNQNQVRMAVHTFLAMEDLVGGIGPQVREIARGFNNSVQATIKAEENIEKRGAFKRFFAGGDEESAEEIEQESKKNMEKLKEMKQLKEECDCTEEVKAMMQEQIQNMEQEQIRLQELADKEKKSKGLFGWMWK